ncbi:MAG TPA: hypothetical protein VMG55_06870 [Stellaceae bacterium]|nr:hypothetical protein [Stellaceae bacterium]
MRQAERAGQADLALGRPSEAVAQYRIALQRAEMRDDLLEIVDYGFDLAVSLLDDNQPDEALKTVRRINAELARRGAQSPPAFTLLEATALYRIGSRADADRLAASIEHASEHDIASQACFLRGLIADENGDLAGLEEASRCLSASGDADRANVLELSARIFLRSGNAGAAESEARDAADLRQKSRDYRGMARALALAGAAASKSGSNAAAASYYLRAGRSAAAQGDTAHARQWIAAALSLSRDPELRNEAQRVLSDVNKK